jgi:hypothetical protein
MRSIPVRLALLLAFAGGSMLHAAEPSRIEQRLTPEQLHATGLDTLSKEQLDLLNRLLESDRASARSVAEGREPVTAADAPVAATRPARAPEPDAGLLGGTERPYTAQARGTIDGWAPGTEFRLDNGQVWKVLKGEAKLPAPRTAPTVKLVPGLGGRWFLEVDESLPKARVYRID